MPPPPPGATFAKFPPLAVPAIPLVGGPGSLHTTNPPMIPDVLPATTTTGNGPSPQEEEYPVKTDRKTYVLATPDDAIYLSDKHCYVRTRLAEIFLSERTDVETPVRGRRATFVGQVGLRCVFCVPSVDSKHRVERAICYPTTTAKFYQTAQDMQHFHFAACPYIPPGVKERYQGLRSNMNDRRSLGGENKGGESSSSADNTNRKMSPKEFWAKCCADLGLIDHIGDDGSNVGVKLKEGHGLVERARLPEYAKELHMPPDEEKVENEDAGCAEADKMNVEEREEIKEDGGMEQVVAEEIEVGVDVGNNGGLDELVADSDGDDKADGDDAEESGDGEGEDAGEGEGGGDDAEKDEDGEGDDAEEDEDAEVDDSEEDGDTEVDDAKEG